MYSKLEIQELKNMSFKDYFINRLRLFFQPLLCCINDKKIQEESCCVINLLSEHIIQTLENSESILLQKTSYVNFEQPAYQKVVSLNLMDDNKIKILKGYL